jgi:hypothetical protein
MRVGSTIYTLSDGGKRLKYIADRMLSVTFTSKCLGQYELPQRLQYEDLLSQVVVRTLSESGN